MHRKYRKQILRTPERKLPIRIPEQKSIDIYEQCEEHWTEAKQWQVGRVKSSNTAQQPTWYKHLSVNGKRYEEWKSGTSERSIQSMKMMIFRQCLFGSILCCAMPFLHHFICSIRWLLFENFPIFFFAVSGALLLLSVVVYCCTTIISLNCAQLQISIARQQWAESFCWNYTSFSSVRVMFYWLIFVALTDKAIINWYLIGPTVYGINGQSKRHMKRDRERVLYFTIYLKLLLNSSKVYDTVYSILYRFSSFYVYFTFRSSYWIKAI